jgi:Mn2+/Fe2+ NRAMP family transporter
LALSLLAYPVVLTLVHVDWGDVLSHAFVPTLVGGAGGLGALIAVFGTTVSPYLFFWQASEEVEEGLEGSTSGQRLTKDHVRAMRVDVIGGMFSAVTIAFIIIVVTASTLHRSGVTTVATAQQAANALKPVAGDFAGVIFAVGIVGLGLLAVPVLAGSTAYALSEAFGWHEGLSRTFKQAKGFYVVLGGSMLAGLVLVFAGLDPIRGLYYAAIFNGLAAPPLIVLLLILGRDSRVAGDHRTGSFSTALLVITIAVSIAAPIAYLAT